MEIEFSEHLIVDPKDIECVICYSRYAQDTNEAMILTCGHTICSNCLKNIKFCPLCRTEILKKPTKNMLLSSLLEKDSHYNKCFLHHKPLEIYSKREERLICSQCLLQQHQGDYEPLQKIESKVKQIKEQETAVNKKKEENNIELYKLLAKKNINTKRKIDELYDEKIAHELWNKKKLKRLADTLMVTEKDRYEHLLLVQGFPIYEENLKELPKVWRNQHNGAVATQILNTPIITEEVVQFYDDKGKEVWGDIHSKEVEIFRLFMEPKNDYEQISYYFSEQIEDTTTYIDIENEDNTEISRNYLLNTLKDYGFEAHWREKNDYIVLEKSVECGALERFYPQFFQCTLEKINLCCHKISDAKFEVLCEILKNIQKLTRLTFDLEKSSSRKIDLISSLFFKLNTVQKFYCRTPLTLTIQNSLKSFIEVLLDSQRISSFTLRCHNSHTLIHYHQELISPSAQTFAPFTRFSVKFIGTTPLIFDPILRMLSSRLINFTSLESIRLCFGKGVKYDKMIDSLCEILPKSSCLFDLNIGFADTNFLAHNSRAQKISQSICTLIHLTKISLFLSGDSLSDDKIFESFFTINEQGVSPEHQLEEFSVTIMRCGYVDIESIVKFLSHFPVLKKLIVKINRVYISFSRLKKFLDSITHLKKLACFELFSRDFEVLNDGEIKELQACKFRLLQYGINPKIVFEELSSQHLPDFVDILSDDSEDNADESDSDYSDESEDEAGARESPE